MAQAEAESLPRARGEVKQCRLAGTSRSDDEGALAMTRSGRTEHLAEDALGVLTLKERSRRRGEKDGTVACLG